MKSADPTGRAKPQGVRDWRAGCPTAADERRDGCAGAGRSQDPCEEEIPTDDDLPFTDEWTDEDDVAEGTVCCEFCGREMGSDEAAYCPNCGAVSCERCAEGIDDLWLDWCPDCMAWSRA